MLKYDQYAIVENTSNFHNQLRLILCNDKPYSNFSCYQEVNVQDLFPDYEYTNHHYDWYIKELNLIIELHGGQHYKATNFNSVSYRQNQINFNLLKFRDSLKRGVAIENGYSYLEIPYSLSKTLTAKTLTELINGI